MDNSAGVSEHTESDNGSDEVDNDCVFRPHDLESVLVYENYRVSDQNTDL